MNKTENGGWKISHIIIEMQRKKQAKAMRYVCYILHILLLYLTNLANVS